MKNTLVSIGWLGSRICYLNVPRDEAIKRYAAQDRSMTIEEIIEEGENPDSGFAVDEFSFDDEFNAYSVYE